MNQKSEDAVIRDVWRKSHGYTAEMLYSVAQELIRNIQLRRRLIMKKWGP
ncbi:MAG: hypothetical protein R3293_23260 [Candidatus Promineifilaceae bacterium]|nr:hypothetical protein [Candidatus Promineifilaceae bacterium]